MIIGNYNYSPIEQGNGYTCGFVKLNFTPRKVEPRVPDASQTGEGQPATGLDALSPEEKTALKNKLHNGQGDLSLQEWDDFLADLEEYGIISHEERFFANGTLREIPGAVLRDGSHAFHGSVDQDVGNMLKGDPLSWLDDMDVYMLKNQLYASMGSRYMYEPGGQRAAFQKVSQITKDLLNCI